MRVCYVADAGTKISGGHQSLLNLISDLKKKDIEPYLVCHKNWEILQVAEKQGIPTKVVPLKIYTARKDKINFIQYIKYVAKRCYNWFHIKSIKNYLLSNNIELVHLNSALSSEVWARAAYECKIPYVWHIREFLDLDHGRIILNSEYSYKWMRRADRVIAISKSVQQYWENVLKCSCTLVYNGLPYEKYKGDTSLKFRDNKLHCIVVGRIVEGKGQMDVVRAIEELKQRKITNIDLTLVGYRALTDYEKSLSEYVKVHELEDYIKLMDFTYDLQNIRQQHDVGITSSKAEAFGRVTIENMLSGMLVIGTNSGGTPELIDDKITGYLYEPGDYTSLADTLQHLIEDYDKNRIMAEEGQKKAKNNFSIENTVNSVYDIYQMVLNTSNR